MSSGFGFVCAQCGAGAATAHDIRHRFDCIAGGRWAYVPQAAETVRLEERPIVDINGNEVDRTIVPVKTGPQLQFLARGEDLGEECDGCHERRLPAMTLCAACADSRQPGISVHPSHMPNIVDLLEDEVAKLRARVVELEAFVRPFAEASHDVDCDCDHLACTCAVGPAQKLMGTESESEGEKP